MLAVVVEHKRFGAALALIVAASYADGVNVTPGCFCLGVNLRVTVNFACAGLKNSGAASFCKTEHVNNTHNRGFHGFNGVVLVVNGGGWASEVVYLVNLSEVFEGNVMANEFKPVVADEVSYVVFRACKEVIEANNIVAVVNEFLGEVRADEPCTACNKNSFQNHTLIISIE